MALNRYVLTAPVTVPAGTPAAVTAGEPGTGGAAGFGSTGISAGIGVVRDSASPLYTYLNGQGVLRPYQQGIDDVGHAAISN